MLRPDIQAYRAAGLWDEFHEHRGLPAARGSLARLSDQPFARQLPDDFHHGDRTQSRRSGEDALGDRPKGADQLQHNRAVVLPEVFDDLTGRSHPAVPVFDFCRLPQPLNSQL
jgi:hypothetical protein